MREVIFILLCVGKLCLTEKFLHFVVAFMFSSNVKAEFNIGAASAHGFCRWERPY